MFFPKILPKPTFFLEVTVETHFWCFTSMCCGRKAQMKVDQCKISLVNTEKRLGKLSEMHFVNYAVSKLKVYHVVMYSFQHLQLTIGLARKDFFPVQITRCPQGSFLSSFL